MDTPTIFSTGGWACSNRDCRFITWLYWTAIEAGVEPWVIVTRPTLHRTLEFVSYFGIEKISRLPENDIK